MNSQAQFAARGQNGTDEIPILIAGEDDLVAEQVRSAFVEKGIVSERVTGIAAACESLRFGAFPVVVVTQLFGDNSWRRLVDLANSNRWTGFLIVLVARQCSSQERVAALDYGAFDVLVIPNELPKLHHCILHAVWSAYLMGSWRWM